MSFSNFVFNNTSPKQPIIPIFVDMDGVIADYRFGEGDNIRTNAPGIYLNKRPIKTTISLLQKVSKLKQYPLYILSSCLFTEQKEEKNGWLDIHAPFFEMERRMFAQVDTFEERIEKKLSLIDSEINDKHFEKFIMIEDTHKVLFEAIKRFSDKVVPFHVISLIS